MAVPTVPLTLEGSYVLHQMMRVRWNDWRRLTPEIRAEALNDTINTMSRFDAGQTGLYSLLGHKGDLLFVHFRKTLDDLNTAEWQLAQSGLWPYLEPFTSYVSVVELGLYQSTERIYRLFAERGLEPDTSAWDEALAEELARQRAAMEPRLFPSIPVNNYICFYPMDRRRGEDKNWYMIPFADRARMMHEHGLAGRRYAGRVRQIISGSIGFDDWEWGVDLFADDPVQFKKLIYDMRFDEVSAVYGLFGAFYTGVRTETARLRELLA